MNKIISKYFILERFHLDPEIFKQKTNDLESIIPVTGNVHLVLTPKNEIYKQKYNNELLPLDEKEGIGNLYGYSLKTCKPECSNEVWATILSFLLVRPLSFGLASTFTKSERGEICSINPYSRSNNLSVGIGKNTHYSSADIHLVSKISTTLLEQWENINNQSSRLSTIIQKFGEAYLFNRLYYADTIATCLFPIMDAFACNPRARHEKRISERLSNFLKIYSEHVIEEDKICELWRTLRHPLLHGSRIKADPPGNQTTSKYLHDLLILLDKIIRSTLLGLLMLPEEKISEYNNLQFEENENIDSFFGIDKKALYEGKETKTSSVA